MRYDTEQTQNAQSPLTGRGLGVRHSGGGDMSGGKKSDLPTGGFTQGPSGGLMMGAYNPSPGSLYREWPSPTSGGGQSWFPW
jgi:hypothetical protein